MIYTGRVSVQRSSQDLDSHFDKQLTRPRPNRGGREWLCAFLKKEQLSGHFLRRELPGTWPPRFTCQE